MKMQILLILLHTLFSIVKVLLLEDYIFKDVFCIFLTDQIEFLYSRPESASS